MRIKENQNLSLFPNLDLIEKAKVKGEPPKDLNG
jgi:hypothetical protein